MSYLREYRKCFQYGKYLNRPDKKGERDGEREIWGKWGVGVGVGGGLFFSFFFPLFFFCAAIFILNEPHDPTIKRVPEPALLNCSRHILPGLELGKRMHFPK